MFKMLQQIIFTFLCVRAAILVLGDADVQETVVQETTTAETVPQEEIQENEEVDQNVSAKISSSDEQGNTMEEIAETDTKTLEIHGTSAEGNGNSPETSENTEQKGEHTESHKLKEGGEIEKANPQGEGSQGGSLQVKSLEEGFPQPGPPQGEEGMQGDHPPGEGGMQGDHPPGEGGMQGDHPPGEGGMQGDYKQGGPPQGGGGKKRRENQEKGSNIPVPTTEFYYEEHESQGLPYVVIEVPDDMVRLVQSSGGILHFLNKVFPVVFR